MHEHPWHDADLDQAATNVARHYNIDDLQAHELVETVAEALEEGGDTIGDVAWDVQQQYPDVAGEDVVDDVAECLGYDDIW
jgi:hypothetical protein